MLVAGCHQLHGRVDAMLVREQFVTDSVSSSTVRRWSINHL